MHQGILRFWLLFCVVVWGWTFVAAKVCLETLHPVDIVALRFLVGVPLLFVVVWYKRIPIRFGPRDLKPILVGSTIITVHFLIQTYALIYTTATQTGWLIGVTPLALAVLAFVFLHEKVTRPEVIGIVIATAGIALLIFNGSVDNFGWVRSAGDVIILISAFTWAIYSLVSRDLSRKHNPLAVTLAMFVPLTVISTGLMLARGAPSLAAVFAPRTAVGLLFLAVPAMVTQWIWQEGVGRLGAAKAGIFLYLEPVATTVAAVVLLGEAATIYTIGGGLMVLGGVWLAEHSRNLVD
jgi:drug/metabolite transporter (DMT)-like permease